MAHAHMAIGVDHVFLRQRAVRDHQVTDELVEIGRIHAHYSPPWVRSASTSSANANRHSIPPNVPKSARIWLPGEHSIGRMNDPDNTVCPASMRPPYRARRSTSHDTERAGRSEEHTSELQSLMRIPYPVFCLTTKHIHRY